MMFYIECSINKKWSILKDAALKGGSIYIFEN